MAAIIFVGLKCDQRGTVLEDLKNHIIPAKFGCKWPVVVEEMIKMWKVNEQTEDGCQLMVKAHHFGSGNHDFKTWSWSYGGWVFNYLYAIITKVVSSNPVHGEVYSIQHYVIKFVSDLRQVGGFLQFPPPIKLTTMI